MTQNELIERLTAMGVDDPVAESCIILERLFGVSYSDLLLNREKSYSSSELDSLLKKREDRVPLQYILGEWQFMGKDFYVSSDCLIPRPDTEILVEKAIEIVKKRTQGGAFLMQNAKCKMQNEENEELAVADLCTGSGCIGLSLLMYTDLKSITLMDISRGALNMAIKNAKRHNLESRCAFVLGDITKEMPQKRFDLIVSNPPYIPSADVTALSEEVKKEPWLALDGGADGLDIIRFLIGDGLSYLKDDGAMLIEFGYDQGEVMDTLLREKQDTGSIKSYKIIYDYGKNPRVALIFK